MSPKWNPRIKITWASDPDYGDGYYAEFYDGSEKCWTGPYPTKEQALKQAREIADMQDAADFYDGRSSSLKDKDE